MTEAGVVLGTAAYMSPEQTRGKPVDQRADIWAFGCVLYEMLTGQSAFGDEDVTVTLARVLERGAVMSALPPAISPDVRQTIKLCLQKDLKKRFADIRDVRLALEGAFEIAAQSTAVSGSPVTSRGRRAWIVALTVAVLAALAFAIPAMRYLRETPPPETRVDIVTPATTEPASFALSPDGRQIVFVAAGKGGPHLWLRSLAATLLQPLPGTEGASGPFWSPDGRSIGFFADGALKRLNLGGGAPQTLARASNASGGTWNADGVIVFAPSRTSPLMRVSASGGAAVAVTALGPQQAGHLGPHFLPDGRRFLFYTLGGPEDVGVYLGALDGSVSARLTPADGAGVYLPAGWLLWAREGTLLAQRLDLAQPALTGGPLTVADGVTSDVNFRGAASVAATGLVAYRAGAGSRRQLTWVDRSGTPGGTFGDADSNGLLFAELAPDDRHVVVTRVVQGNFDLWLLDGARTTRLTFDANRDAYPKWSPDSTRIVFFSTRTGKGDLYQKLWTGADPEQPLLVSDQVKVPLSWSPDGRFLLYSSIDPQTNSDLWVLPMTGDTKPWAFLKTEFREIYGAFSPDGQWVAYQSDESGRPEVYVRPFVPPGATGTSAGAAQQVSTAGGTFPAWERHGKELYYLNPAGEMMAASISVTGSALTAGAPEVLFRTHIFRGGTDVQQGWQYSVAADGRFLMNTELDDDVGVPITLIQNWNPDAKK
jgi:Tol biopolymer transport system component